MRLPLRAALAVAMFLAVLGSTGRGESMYGDRYPPPGPGTFGIPGFRRPFQPGTGWVYRRLQDGFTGVAPQSGKRVGFWTNVPYCIGAPYLPNGGCECDCNPAAAGEYTPASDESTTSDYAPIPTPAPAPITIP